MKAPAQTLILAMIVVLVSNAVSSASIIENGMLNTIDQAGNASDGLSYLDVTFSVGLTQDAALTAAQNLYTDARLATASEFDDLFQAAGITYTSSLTAASGFDVGIDATISSVDDYDGGALMEVLGITRTDFFPVSLIWTDPDGDSSTSTTRDAIQLSESSATIYQTTLTPANPGNLPTGWLIVTGPSTGVIPEPTSLLCWLGVASIGLTRRRRN